MKWNKANKSCLVNTEQVGLESYRLNLSQIDIEPEPIVDNNSTSDYETDSQPMIVNVKYVPIEINTVPTIDAVKSSLVTLQKEYDKSNKVNIFTVNNVSGWLDSETRLAIRNAITVLDSYTYSLWLGDICLKLKSNDVISILNSLEAYAVQCFNTTSNKVVEIKETTDFADLFEYDITKGYPTPPTFNFEEE